MGASQTLHLIEKLTEANISKETATELIEFVEQAQKGTVSKDYIDARFEGLEASIDARFESLESKFKGLEASVNTRFESLESKFKSLEASVNAKIMGLRLFLGFNTALLLAVLAKLFLT